MERVLDVYQKPFDAAYPVVNMDEQSVQLLADKRPPIPMSPGSAIRVDNEYVRKGTASVFLFTEILRGWRKVSVRERRTAVDWAEEIKRLLDEDYPDAEEVILICDNLNTHKLASLSKAFDASEAARLCSRLFLCYTPKHGSWLNIAEIELSVFKRQCLWHRRIPDVEMLTIDVQVFREAKMNLPTPLTDPRAYPIIGESEPMRVVLRKVQQVAPTSATVLITGETGVGKEVIAQTIHENSPRKNRLFKAVNCGVFYQDLLQSELFGHEKGAFTGATSQRRGVFELADGGTRCSLMR